LGLIRLELEACENKIEVTSGRVVRLPLGGKPKLLDQCVTSLEQEVLDQLDEPHVPVKWGWLISGWPQRLAP
jgi:hypothetical protein